MAKASGLFVILAGIAGLCTAYLLHSGAETDRLASSRLTDISSKAAEIVKGADSGLKAPDSGQDTALAMASEGWRAYVGSMEPEAEVVEPEAEVVVTITKRSNDQKVNAEITARASSTAPRSLEPASLARELQRELKRVGCYDGAINDSWTLSTRTAMKAFTNRINAMLPVDKPDQILLALVQDYRDRLCDVACPAGEGLAKDGRCLPNAVLARATKKVAQRNAKLQTVEPPGGHVTLVWSTTTPPQPELGGPARGSALPAGPPTKTAYRARGAAATAKRSRIRAMTASQGVSRHHGDFASTIFRRADALGPH
jgi:hypothetical protein